VDVVRCAAHGGCVFLAYVGLFLPYAGGEGAGLDRGAADLP